MTNSGWIISQNNTLVLITLHKTEIQLLTGEVRNVPLVLTVRDSGVNLPNVSPNQCGFAGYFISVVHTISSIFLDRVFPFIIRPGCSA